MGTSSRPAAHNFRAIPQGRGKAKLIGGKRANQPQNSHIPEAPHKKGPATLLGVCQKKKRKDMHTQNKRACPVSTTHLDEETQVPQN